MEGACACEQGGRTSCRTRGTLAWGRWSPCWRPEHGGSCVLWALVGAGREGMVSNRGPELPSACSGSSGAPLVLCPLAAPFSTPGHRPRDRPPLPPAPVTVSRSSTPQVGFGGTQSPSPLISLMLLGCLFSPRRFPLIDPYITCQEVLLIHIIMFRGFCAIYFQS